jgi:hypothetical protein
MFIQILVGKPEEKHLRDIGMDGSIILKWILNRQAGRV